MRITIVAAMAACSLAAAPRFQFHLGAGHTVPVDGRLILVISRSMQGEPRFQVAWGLETQQIFGMDLDGWKPGDTVEMAGTTPGAPLQTLDDLAEGTYNVQAVLNVYETFHRADGHALKLHADHGEGQKWNRSPGNLYSKPQKVDVRKSSVTTVELTEMIPPIDPPKDTKYIRHLRLQSKMLTEFWGRPVFLNASVLVPRDLDESSQRYPVAFSQNHFSGDFRGFRETPPTGNPPNQNEAAAYQFYQDWASGRLPRMLVVVTDHATPYYDDSYGVNTANAGPYGDALTKELYPAIEKQFRAIGEPWARVVFGGSTGGWMTLAQQIFYPEYFGGAWGFCPDPVDFHAFQSIDVYKDTNAYYDEGPFLRFPKLLGRLPNDHILATMESFSRQEAVLGTRGRSGGQLDAFHATFGPTDADGYPAKMWDSETGAIHLEVAKYWRDHYDLTALLERDWERLGPKLQGKIHVTMGTKDTFYLDAAAHRLEQFLESTKRSGKGPYYGGTFDFGNNEPHCYPGKIPEGVPNLTYFVRTFAEYMRNTAPKGADLAWR
ncbi:MAG TPA: alpha/beta hydrolase-fold protein [Bryobacteraceae bacterium]|nr:alpha/beta hydrolase-fold protein [Bryobacteraceae bacterium]